MVLLAKVVEMIGGFVFVLMGSDTFGPFLQTWNVKQVTARHVTGISDDYTYLCSEFDS